MNYKIRLYEDDQSPANQLATGISVEREHTGTYKRIRDYYEEHSEWPSEEQVFTWIAKDHLKEKPTYYKTLLDAGL